MSSYYPGDQQPEPSWQQEPQYWATMPQQAVPQQSQRRRGGMGFAIAAAVFLVLALIFVPLFLSERSAHEKTRAQVAAKEKSLSDTSKSLEEQKGKVTQLEKDKQAQATELEELRKCKQAAKDSIAGVAAKDDPKTKDAIDRMFKHCDADR
ncbi:hypothetical protein [Longispora albida]|uniref:hypothetical protein n=1 Tax=Longispora albida TaxID=203523 RepID=UPI00037CB092|nr:hypothetical protein [Longispora albida]